MQAFERMVIGMEKDDTIKLLCECDSGIKIAVNSIDELTEHVVSITLKDILTQYRKDHEAIGKHIQDMLTKYQMEGKDPNSMVKAMSWLKINAKLIQNPTDHEVADIMMDGCNMGIKSVCKYRNQYRAANEEAKSIVEDIVSLEQKLMIELRSYL